MKINFLFYFRSIQTLVALLLTVVFVNSPAYAQKVLNKKIRTTYHKTPVVILTPKYSSYSIEYDYGDMVAPAGERPELPSLEFKKAGGDLLLKMRVKSVYSADKELKLDQSDGKQKAYYNVAYKADYGYDLIEKVSGDVIASYKRAGGIFTTPSFGSKTEMDMYMKNGLESDLFKYLVNKVNDRVSYDLVPNKYTVRLVINSIDGQAPAYQEINKASASFLAAITTPEINKEKVRSLTDVWENHLKQVNWEDKKSEINRKVGLALLENLCAAYLLLEDYPKLNLKAELADSKNKGLLSDFSALTFEIDGNYPGPCSYTKTTIKYGKISQDYNPTFAEFARDLIPKD